MNMISRIGAMIRRLRHRRGFGVHSPLAYSVVREVLYPDHRYAYYGHLRLDGLGLSEERSRMMERAIRLIGFIRSDGVVTNPSLTDQEAELLQHVSSRVKRLRAGADTSDAPLPRNSLLLDFNGEYTPGQLKEFLDAPGRTAMVFSGKRTDPDFIPGELVLSLDDCWLAFSRLGMQRIVYDF